MSTTGLCCDSRKALHIVMRILSDDDMLHDLNSSMKACVLNELIFLDLYMICSDKWNESPFDNKDNKFGFFDGSQVEDALLHALSKEEKSEQDCFELVENIHQCVPNIENDCFNFLDSSFEFQFSVAELQEFLFSISASLDNLLIFKADMIIDIEVKVESLRDNLDFFREVFEFTQNHCRSSEAQEDFKLHIEACACRAACITLLYWAINEKKEAMAPRLDIILSDLLKETNPSTPEVTWMYLVVLKASKTSEEDGITAGKLVMKFVEILKDNSQVNPEEEGIQMLFTDLIFLITFLMNGREASKFAEEILILTEANTLLNEVASLIISFSSDESKQGSAEEGNLLHTFLEKAKEFKAKVRKFYTHTFPYSPFCNFPGLNHSGFIDSLLVNLKELCSYFPKHQIMMLQKAILSLKESYLETSSILELQNKPKDIKNLGMRIVNVTYNAERAVSSFVFLRTCLWHDILCISDAIEEIKLIKEKMKRIQDQHVFGIGALNSEASPIPVLPLQASVSKNKVVGFRVQEKELRDQIVSGSEKLCIISIVGMPGLGKTTLAQKIYADASVQDHFNKSAWCTTSQTFNCKRILLDILGDLIHSDDNVLCNMEEEDLAESIYRSLKGQRYLIVIDDIWDVRVWDELKEIFPDDNMGSRIMFTTRIHSLIQESKLPYRQLPLDALSEDESWELLENRLFHKGKCPTGLLEIGKKIARKCKGLPLAVVITAGLLKEKIECVNWWNHVGESPDLLMTKEGCRDVLELSYRHLPEFLKPCFLYFGIFEEDEEIKVKKLIRLWISEGFVQKQEMKSIEVVAEEYLNDLVSRSLVIVTKTSSRGGIKACGVHDLLRDFCIAKGEEENFIKLVPQGKHARNMDAHYRVRFQKKYGKFSLEHVPLSSSVRSLFYFTRYGYEEVQSLAFSHFKFLRVLNLHIIVNEFPENLVLLRYLAINFLSGDIPESVKRLENLETLCLYDMVTHELPTTFWEMQKLRHVSGEFQLPDDFCEYDIVPLETVRTFCTKLHYEQAETFFRTVPKVQKLKCRLLFSSGRQSHVQIMKRLRRCIMNLDFLTHLESLYLDHYETNIFGLYSCLFYFPPNLKKLTLKGFSPPWSVMSQTAKLQNLEVLKLYGGFLGRTWNVEDEEFLKLKCLVLSDLGIAQLNASDDSFPCLKRLVIERCVNFKMVPSRFGSIYSLKMIQVKDCKYSLNESVRRIQEEQFELGNEDFEVRISGGWNYEY